MFLRVGKNTVAELPGFLRLKWWVIEGNQFPSNTYHGRNPWSNVKVGSSSLDHLFQKVMKVGQN
jgi:hypothetical protein